MKKAMLILAIMAAPVMASESQPVVVSQTERYLDLLDQDRDRGLTLEEMRLGCDVTDGLFRQADKNKDGELSFAELRTARRYIFARCGNLVAS